MAYEFQLNTGERGPRGYSAYQIAVQNGFEGTEAEWLESLEGEQGIQGEQGEQGETGPQGDPASVTSENTLTALEAMDAEQQADAREAIDASSTDVQGTSDVINAQPFCAKKIAGWTTGGGGTAPPLRALLLGDSFATGMQLGPHMGRTGYIGLGQTAGTTAGTITNYSVSNGNSRFDLWTNGVATEFAVGASSQFTVGSQTTGDIAGDRIMIAYIKRSGGGSFVLQYAANGNGAASAASDTGWTTLDTIDTSNATTVGAVNTYTVANGNFYRLRIKTVTTGSVIILFNGIYQSNGGGVIWMPVCAGEGHDITQAITTPAAIFDPVWDALAPDFVLTCWADGASNWESGGAFRTLYANATAQQAETDWIVVSANPSADETGRPEQRAAQRAWAVEERQTWINGFEMMGGSYEVARDRGLMRQNAGLTNVTTTNGSPNISFNNYGSNPGGEVSGTGIPVGTTIVSSTSTTAVLSANATASGSGLSMILYDQVHLSTAGARVRNLHLWQTLPLFQWPLGQEGWATEDGMPMFRLTGNSTNLDQVAVECLHPLQLRGSNPYLYLWPIGGISTSVKWTIWNDATNTLNFSIAGALCATMGGGAEFGVHPGSDGNKLGRNGLRWRLWADGVQTNISSKTTTYAATAADHTILCDATSGAFDVDLPAAASHSGRIFVIKKVDASGNAVSIDPNGTELIDGSSTSVAISTQWQSITVQSNGTSWFIIGKYTP